MTHRRKKFLIYPPEYCPGDGYEVRYSKLQAWKCAAALGVGAIVDVGVNVHPGKRQPWVSSTGYELWEVVRV